jgi:hypothetical protein
MRSGIPDSSEREIAHCCLAGRIELLKRHDVLLLMHQDPLIGPQTPIQLVISYINTVYKLSPTLQQTVSEAPCRGTGIQHDEPFNREGK